MMEPTVRQLVVCEDARTRQGSADKIDVFGIMNRVKMRHFPCNLSFAVYFCLTDGRGMGEARIVVKKAVDEDTVYVGDLHPLDLGTDPLLLHPYVIRVFTCPVPEPGLLSVDLVYNEVVLESYVLRVEGLT